MSMTKQNEKYSRHEKLCACLYLKRIDHIFLINIYSVKSDNPKPNIKQKMEWKEALQESIS